MEENTDNLARLKRNCEAYILSFDYTQVLVNYYHEYIDWHSQLKI